MTTILGKRKTRSSLLVPKPSVSLEDAQAIFRRHFEAQFKPLSEAHRQPVQPAEDIDGDGQGVYGSELDSEWSGLSDTEGEPSTKVSAQDVVVIEHIQNISTTTMSKQEAKAFLSSRPPSAVALSSTTQTKTDFKTATAPEEDSADLLKNDLALQRLLAESHLLSSARAFASQDGVSDANWDMHTGRNRLKATDMRLASLGSKESIFVQTKRPMSHRKGIIAAAEARERKRRREASENGIILERPTDKKARPMRRRERAVDAPAVGKLRDGMLRLSKKDVAEIQGSGDSRGGRAIKGRKRR